jgi:toxin-antitoxin system PIN domain toxin
MLLPDVNVFVNAINEASTHHRAAADWLNAAAQGEEPVGIPDLVLSSVVLVCTGSHMAGSRRTPGEAFAFCDAIRQLPLAVRVVEGPKHWSLFREAVLGGTFAGSDVSDVYLAAFALENDATFVTFDRGFQRFPGLRVQVPGGGERRGSSDQAKGVGGGA